MNPRGPMLQNKGMRSDLGGFLCSDMIYWADRVCRDCRDTTKTWDQAKTYAAFVVQPQTNQSVAKAKSVKTRAPRDLFNPCAICFRLCVGWFVFRQRQLLVMLS